MDSPSEFSAVAADLGAQAHIGPDERGDVFGFMGFRVGQVGQGAQRSPMSPMYAKRDTKPILPPEGGFGTRTKI